MPLIEVSQEDLVFLRELAHEMRAQDNCATASPRYYVVMQKRELLAPAGHGDKECFFDGDSEEGRIYRSREEFADSLRSAGHSEQYIDSRMEGVEQLGLHVLDRPSNFFLTRKGYDEHIRLNGHNYNGTEHPYMEHAFRNPELRKLVEVIDRLGSNNV